MLLGKLVQLEHIYTTYSSCNVSVCVSEACSDERSYSILAGRKEGQQTNINVAIKHFNGTTGCRPPPPFRLMTKSMSVLSIYFPQISDFCFSHLSPTKPVFPSFSVSLHCLYFASFFKRVIFDHALLNLEVAIAKNVVYFHRNE
jgi:hypothetical protein